MFPDEFGDIYDTITQAHEKYHLEEISLGELSSLHLSRFPAITNAYRKNLELIFQGVAEEETVNDEIAYDLLSAASVREKARLVGIEAINVINGKSNTLHELKSLLEELETAPEDVTNVTEAPKNIEDVLQGVQNNVIWKFNVPTLAPLVSGIGPGLFVVVGARPEAGKTLTHVHFTSGPDGFAWQGARVDKYINEEPAVRTMMREICAATGMTELEILQNPEQARPIWDKIKKNITLFDAVGLTLEELDAHIQSRSPDVVVVDQLDKLQTSGKYNRTDEKLRDVYTGFREILKRRQIAGIGYSQISAEGEGKFNLNFSMLENSKTGKAAEADLILLLGRTDAPEQEFLRQINIPKNKISGRHESVMVTIHPQISRLGV